VWRQLNDEHLADGALQACFFDTKASITFGFVQDCRPYVQHDVSDLDAAKMREEMHEATGTKVIEDSESLDKLKKNNLFQ
jgi:hypothetical protein